MNVDIEKYYSKRLVLLVLLSIVFFAILIYVVAVNVDVKKVVVAVTSISLAQWLLILSLSLANYIGRFFRWLIFINQLENKINLSYIKHFVIYCIGFAYCTTPGKAGEVVRSLYLKNYGVRHRSTFSALFIERLMDLVVMLLLSCSLLFYFQIPNTWLVSFIALCAFSTLVIFNLKILYKKLKWKLFVIATQKISNFISSIFLLLNLKILVGSLLIGFVSWFAEGFGFYLILKYLGVATDLWLLVGIYAVATLAGALSFIPGGLGGAEVVMYLMLVTINISPEIAVSSTLIFRVATLWFAVILGFICQGLFHVVRLFVDIKN